MPRALTLPLAPLAPLTALALLLAGCSYSAPTLKVAEVRVKERTDAGLVLDIAVDAENRNEVELPLREVHYTVRLETTSGTQTFTGVRSPEASLRRLGVQRIHFPAVFPLSAGAPAATQGEARCQVSGSLKYTTPGELGQLLFDAGVRRPSVGFTGEAAVNLGAAP